MAVAVLGLHDHGGFEDGVAHEGHVRGALGWVVAVFLLVLGTSIIVWTWRHTHVGNLLGPHGMNQITLLIIRGFLEKTPCAQRLLSLIVLLAFLEQSAFLGCFHQQRRNSNRPIPPISTNQTRGIGEGGMNTSS